jgi:putative phage-type endonuclease
MAAILGLDPRRNAYDVWLEKTGRLEEEPENQAMIAGTMFEDGVLQYAERELGKLVRNQFRSAKSAGLPLGANIDAMLVEGGVPVEVKTSGLYGPLTEQWGEPLTDQVPDRVIIQATVHMICSLTDLCHIAAFLGGRGFVRYVVNLDPVIKDIVCDRANAFWKDHVLKDIPPANVLPHPAIVKRVRREPESLVEIDPELIDTWLKAKDAAKLAKTAEENAQAAVLAALGDAEAADCELGRFTYFSQSRLGIDTPALKAEKPNIYEAYLKETTYRVARFKKAAGGK